MPSSSSVIAIISSGAFVLFFLGWGVALLLRNYDYVSKFFFTGFMSVVLVINLVGISMLPIVALHKFSKPDDLNESYHQIYVVDSTGQELYLDSKATPPKLNYHLRELGDSMLNEYSPSKANQVSCHLLLNANAHRQKLLSGNDRLDLSFPPHALEPHWQPEKVRDMGNFTGLYIYRIDFRSNEPGTRIVDREKELVYSFDNPEHKQVCAQS